MSNVVELNSSKEPQDASNVPVEEPQKKKPPIETFWSTELMKRGNYAYELDEQGECILYHFNTQKRFWEKAHENNVITDVTRFLTSKHYDRYSERSKKVCTSITQSHILTFGRKLVKTDDFVISTNSHFLEVQKNGRIRAYNKDELGGDCKKYFCRVHVDVDLPRGVQEYYVPQSNTVIEDKDSYFSKILKLGFPKDENLRCFQEFFGDTLNPETRKCFPVLIGPPDGGKSQVLSIVASMHLRSTSIDLDTLDTADAQSIVGCSFVEIDEIGKSFSEKHVKRLIGGSKMMVKRKYLPNLSITPDFKIFGADNFVFNYSEKSGAIESRFFFIKVEEVPKSKRINGIGKKAIKNDSIDILDWALNGAVAVLRRGRVRTHEEMPEDSKALVEAMANKTNYANNFLKDVGAQFSEIKLVPKIELYQKFVQYCILHGKIMSAKVSFEVWCRDYFKSAMLKVDPSYDEKFERRARKDGKQVMCFPLVFKNEALLNGVVSDIESAESRSRIEAYDEKCYPDHILERIKKERLFSLLTDEQKKAILDDEMIAGGYKKEAGGGYSKTFGEGEIEF